MPRYKKKISLEVAKTDSPNPHLKTGFYRKKIDLHRVNGRTKLGRAVREITRQLREYVGTGGNITTELLAQRVVYKVLRLSFYEKKKLSNLEDFMEADHYIPLCNSLRLDLRALSAMIGEERPPSLQDYLNSLRNAERKDGSK